MNETMKYRLVIDRHASARVGVDMYRVEEWDRAHDRWAYMDSGSKDSMTRFYQELLLCRARYELVNQDEVGSEQFSVQA